jgi:hypothetical protein
MLHITHAPHGDGIVAIETLSVIELELKALALVSVLPAWVEPGSPLAGVVVDKSSGRSVDVPDSSMLLEVAKDCEVIDVCPPDACPMGVCLAESLVRSASEGLCDPFSGPTIGAGDESHS